MRAAQFLNASLSNIQLFVSHLFDLPVDSLEQHSVVELSNLNCHDATSLVGSVHFVAFRREMHYSSRKMGPGLLIFLLAQLFALVSSIFQHLTTQPKT